MAEVGAYTFMVNVFKTIIAPASALDDFCFRLHHHYTSRMLVITVFMSFLYKLLDPISCFTLNKDFPDKVLNSYCLMQNTYTLPEALDKQIGSEVAFQGVDKADPDDHKEYQRYYQWVPVLLLMQAMLFKLPYYLWETKERNNIRGLILGMDKPLPVTRESSNKQPPEVNEQDEVIVPSEDVKMLAHYLMDTRGKYRAIACWFLACYVLNLVNVALQLVFTDIFLGGELLESKWHIIWRINANYNERTDKMVALFPRVTKCTFNQFGVGGDVQHYDAMCIMPFNFFYEWIFIFNVAWFMFVTIMTSLYVLCYLGSFVSHRFQVFLLELPCICRSSNDPLKSVLKEMDFGHRFVLIMLRSRFNMLHFEKLVDELTTRLGLNKDDDEEQHSSENEHRPEKASLLNVRST